MCTSTATVKLISSAERLNEEIDKRDKRIAALERELENKSDLLERVLERLRPLMPIVAALLPGRVEQKP